MREYLRLIPTLQERRRWQRGQIAKGASVLPVDIMLNEREIMESEIIRSRMQPMGVVIQPDVAHFHVRRYKPKRSKPEQKRRSSGFPTFASSLRRARAKSSAINPVR
jgi:hypothetical protein